MLKTWLLIFFVIYPAIDAYSQPSGNFRDASDKLIVEINPNSWIPQSVSISPDCKRVAYFAKAGGKEFAIIDGKESKRYAKIWDNPFPNSPYYHLNIPLFSPDSRRIAYVAEENQKKFVVVDGIEGKPYDDISEWYEPAGVLSARKAMAPPVRSPIIFSPDSKQIAYCAKKDEKEFVVLNAQEGKKYFSIQSSPIFSYDSKHLAFGAVDENTGFYRIIIDSGKVEETPFSLKVAVEDIAVFSVFRPVFSPDSRRIAFVITGPTPHGIVVVDGKESKLYGTDYFSRILPVFSPDSKNIAFVISDSNYFVMLNCKRLKEYDNINSEFLKFSPDSKRLAYPAQRGEKWLMVIDEKEGKEFDNISAPEFSPDSKKVAYIGWEGADENETAVLVLDGKEIIRYKSIHQIVFSPDSKRIAFVGYKGNKPFVVTDSTEGKKYDAISRIAFSPDSKIIAYTAQQNDKCFLVVDDTEGKRYQVVGGIDGQSFMFDGPDKWHYIAFDSNKFYLVEEYLKGEQPGEGTVFQTLLKNGKSEFDKPFDEQDFAVSIKYLEEAEKIKPDNQEVHYFLGYAYDRLCDKDGDQMSNANLGLFKKASAHFKKVIAIAPKYEGELVVLDPYSKITSIWGSLAMAYLSKGQVDSAIWAFKYGQSEGGYYPAILEYDKNIMASCEKDAILFTNGDNDTFPMWFLQLIEGYRKDISVVNLSLLNAIWYIKWIKDQEPKVTIGNLSDEMIDQLNVVVWSKKSVKISPPPDSDLPPLVWELEPTINDKGLRVQDIMILLILENNKWRRPVYFSTTVSSENRINLDDYLTLEGLVFHLMSHKAEHESKNRLFKNCIENYTYAGIHDKNLQNIPGMISLYTNYRIAFFSLAMAYYNDGEFDRAKDCIEAMKQKVPEEIVPYVDQRVKERIENFYKSLSTK